MTGVKKNFFYSAFLTSANYIFPLLTFPYVTRVLGAANYGLCGFIDGIINYFILFSTMGIAVVGIREIASDKSDARKMNRTFMELFVTTGLFTLISIVLLIGATFLVPKLYEQKELMFFGAFKVAFNFLLIEWFYKGIEDFRFITLRTLIVKCGYVASVFIFVRTSEDYPAYYLLSVLMIAVNAVINILYCRKWITFSLKSLSLKRFLRPLITYGVYSLLTSFYTTFNVAYLGFVSSDIEVGYYSVATKLYTIFIAIVTAFTSVMMPRMASLLAENRTDEFRRMYVKSVDILSSVTVPSVIFCIIMAPQIVDFIAGKDYGGAVVPFMLVIPLMFIIGYEQIMIVQGLMPMRKDKIVLRNSVVGAVVGLTANFLLVSRLAAVGSALVWLICEILILILSQIAITRYLDERFPNKVVLKSLLVYAPLCGLYWLKSFIHSNAFVILVISGSVSLLYFLFVQLKFFPGGPCSELLKRILGRLR